ncbi:MAG: phytoene synthase [Gammaproteobacteria bacterium]|nr:MAG: phytoene synthase [Gammaproteobacteria bacterium]TND07071.1 MAG: phytoene synthase [Gammaproteobacteria bacterium]
MTPQQYCENKAAKSGSSFYYSFLFLPTERREAITALYAFCREVDDVVDECHDAAVARTKLQWWREEIARMFDDAPRHPVTKALLPAIRRYELPAEYFQEIIDGMEMDLAYSSYPSFRELALYCYRVAGVVGLMAAEIFGYQDRQTQKYAKDLGTAFQLTNILRDVREDAGRGRVYIPLDEVSRFSVSHSDITEHRMSDNMRQLLEYQGERARRYYQQAFQQLPDIDRYAQRAGLIMAAIYLKTLDEIAVDGYRVLEHRVALTPLRKLWIAWRTSRSEKRRDAQLQRKRNK